MRGLAFACLPVVLTASRAADDEDVLLALKNQRMSLDAGLGLDLMSAATERNVTQMQALVQSLVEESIQGDGVANLDDDIQQALQIIKSTLLDGIRNTLKTEHKQDQDAIMAQLKCFDTCQRIRDGVETDCDKHRVRIDELRKQHVECRGSVMTHYVDKVKKCNALDDWVEAFRLSVKVVEECVYGEEYECRTSTCKEGQCEPEIDGKFGAWLKQIITEAKEGYKTWLGLHKKCKESYHAYIQKDSGCDVTQADFQAKVCELGQCEYTACNVEYTRCRADCIADYHREVKRVECAEKDRKIDWSATEKIECYIGILLASPTDDELQALCHDDMTNCISKWRTGEYDKCNDVCKEIDFESGAYSQHDRRGAHAGDSLYDHRRTGSVAGTDGMVASTQGSRQLADNAVAGDRSAGVNTTHRGTGEHLTKRCTSHLDIDFQPIPCAKPCDELPDLPCTTEFINAEYSQFLRATEVSDVADKRKCHSGEHSEKWAYNLCDCPIGKNPPVGTFFCPIVGTPSITKDDYCEKEPIRCSAEGCELGVIACGARVWHDRDYVFTNPPAHIDGATLFVQPHKSLPAGTYHYHGLPIGGVVFLTMEKEHSHRDGGIQLDGSWTQMSDKIRWHSSVSSTGWYKTITESTVSVTITKSWVGYVAFHGPSKNVPQPMLLMKVSKNGGDTLHYDSSYWTDDVLLNEQSLLDVDEHAKYPAFLTAKIKKVRMCMGGPSSNCVDHELASEYSSAKELFNSGFVRDENLDRDGIIGAFGVAPGSYRVCPMQRPGFNTICKDGNRARWGFCVNCASQPCQSADTNDADAVIGIGLHGQKTAKQSSGWTGYFASGEGTCRADSRTEVSVWFYALPQKADVLVMKVSKNGGNELAYDSALWENTDTLNPSSAPDADEHAKYAGFNTVEFQTIKMCMGGPQGSSTAKCVVHELAQSYGSALELFSAGFVRDENLDRDGIIEAFGVAPGSYRVCPMQRPGFNTVCKDGNRARWGFCVNCASQPCQSADSNDADAAIGIGLHGQKTNAQSSGWTGYFASGEGTCTADSRTEVSVWFYVSPNN